MTSLHSQEPPILGAQPNIRGKSATHTPFSYSLNFSWLAIFWKVWFRDSFIQFYSILSQRPLFRRLYHCWHKVSDMKTLKHSSPFFRKGFLKIWVPNRNVTGVSPFFWEKNEERWTQGKGQFCVSQPTVTPALITAILPFSSIVHLVLACFLFLFP